MLEICINGNSMMSLSNHACPSLVQIEGRKTSQLDDFKYARKLEVGCWNNDKLPDDKFKDYK